MSTLKITMSADNGRSGTITASPTTINVPHDLWYLLYRIFPTGFYPFLDPTLAYQKLLNLPDHIDLPQVGGVDIGIHRG